MKKLLILLTIIVLTTTTSLSQIISNKTFCFTEEQVDKIALQLAKGDTCKTSYYFIDSMLNVIVKQNNNNLESLKKCNSKYDDLNTNYVIMGSELKTCLKSNLDLTKENNILNNTIVRKNKTIKVFIGVTTLETILLYITFKSILSP